MPAAVKQFSIGNNYVNLIMIGTYARSACLDTPPKYYYCLRVNKCYFTLQDIQSYSILNGLRR